MSEELDLSVPDRGKKNDGRPRMAPFLLALLLILGVLNLVFSLNHGTQRQTGGAGSGLGPEARKELALKLEKQGLRVQAIGAWREYLDAAGAGSEESARIWYRMGKLHQEAQHPEEALECYYRSESFAKLDELAPEINRRTQECLEAAGKFSALKHELAERVDIGEGAADESEEVVAEIGAQKITQADLDRMIEEQVERQLGRFGSFLPPEERKKQEEAMLKQLSTPSQRLQLLEQLVSREALYRRARESGLTDDPDIRAELKDLEKQALAQKAVEAELADKIKITPGDLETYYEAHKKEYVRPARARISHILVKDQKTAREVLDSLGEKQTFEDLAESLSEDEKTKDRGGEIEGWVQKGSYIPGIGYSDDATAAIFSTEAGEVAEKPVKTDKGFHVIKVREREPERQKSLDEVRGEVFRALRRRKEQEVQEALLAELKDRYDIVIHRSRFAPEGETEEENDEESGE
ncbi:MAG: peptidyl-prolyl cis-trans isomerase [Planctomycetes bacterium]|nr:peptidyl-prolyl cis-trans isomerase [Planctomycetota bacterium]